MDLGRGEGVAAEPRPSVGPISEGRGVVELWRVVTMPPRQARGGTLFSVYPGTGSPPPVSVYPGRGPSRSKARTGVVVSCYDPIRIEILY